MTFLNRQCGGMTAAKKKEKAKCRTRKEETSEDSKQKDARSQTSPKKLRHVGPFSQESLRALFQTLI